MLVETRRLSSFCIRTSIVGQEESIWLAQSEGRRKNSDDRTQTSIIKMLSMSSESKD